LTTFGVLVPVFVGAVMCLFFFRPSVRDAPAFSCFQAFFLYSFFVKGAVQHTGGIPLVDLCLPSTFLATFSLRVTPHSSLFFFFFPSSPSQRNLGVCVHLSTNPPLRTHLGYPLFFAALPTRIPDFCFIPFPLVRRVPFCGRPCQHFTSTGPLCTGPLWFLCLSLVRVPSLRPFAFGLPPRFFFKLPAPKDPVHPQHPPPFIAPPPLLACNPARWGELKV